MSEPTLAVGAQRARSLCPARGGRRGQPPPSYYSNITQILNFGIIS